MIRMKKEWFLDRVRAVFWLSLWIVPIPFGMLASDKSFFAPLSVLVFLIASISLPVTVRYRQEKRTADSIYAPVPSLIYGGFVAMFMAIGVLNGCMVWDIWKNYYARMALFFVWMVGTIGWQSVLAWGFAYWQEHKRSRWYSEFIDPILYSLPLPCALLGMFTYPAVFQEEVSVNLAIGLMAIIGFGFLLISICTIATVAFYFYPSKKRGYTGRERWIQLARVLVMVVVWLLVHNRFFDTAIGVFVVHMMPLSANNPLVFLTPFVFEGAMIIACVALGNLTVLGLHALAGKNK